MEVPALLPVVFFAAAMLWAAATDIHKMQISNKLVAALLIAYCVFAAASGMAPQQVGFDALVAFGALLCGFFFFTRGWLGGGDVKLGAVTILWLGADNALAYVAYTAFFGGFLALALLYFRSRVLPSSLQQEQWIARLHSINGGIPYGLAMASAALVVLPNSVWMERLI